MMKWVWILLLAVVAVTGTALFVERNYWLWKPSTSVLNTLEGIDYKEGRSEPLAKGFELLKVRRDNEAWSIFERFLSNNPNNIDALWAKAELLRRRGELKEAEEVLNRIFAVKPQHTPSLVILSYLKYKNDRLDDAQAVIRDILSMRSIDKDSQALAYMMLGKINMRRFSSGNFINKLRYATQIEPYLLRAEESAPDSAEIRVALGSFYLTAPAIIGGSLDKAIRELTKAVELAPDFADANAMLAWACKDKHDYANYGFYVTRTRQLDPSNEILKGLGEN